MSEINNNHPIIQKAKRLVSDNPRKMSEEEIQRWAEYSRRVLHQTPEEKLAVL